MQVLKFGGSSLKDLSSLDRVCKTIREQSEPCIVVVSAFEGVSHRLIGLAQEVASGKVDYEDKYACIFELYEEFIKQIDASARVKVEAFLRGRKEEYLSLLRAVAYLRELSPKTQARILSIGVELSARTLAAYIPNACYVEATECIKTEEGYLDASVDIKRTYEAIRGVFEGFGGVAVLAGYIGRNTEGEVSNLGKRGADYTAALIAAAVKAKELVLWMNVDGFMTADPDIISKAKPIAQLSYLEAMELSHFGAAVVYTPSLQPVSEAGIPLHIRNTYNPEAEGTVISVSGDGSGAPIKGISSINSISLLGIQSASLVGKPNLTAIILTTLAQHNINIIMIVQSSSEYSINIAVEPEVADLAARVLQEQLSSLRITIKRELSLVAVVGEGMRGKPGVSSTFFKSLSRNGINVITAQSSSEVNLSAVVPQNQLRKAIYAIHEGFFLGKYKELHLFLAGIGTVGKSLVRQIGQMQSQLAEELKLNINIIGIANSKKLYLNAEGIAINQEPLELLEMYGKAYVPQDYLDGILKLNLRNSVFIDCTGSSEIPTLYESLLRNYVSVVTANKTAAAGDYGYYKTLKSICRENGTKYLFETNVGAGLPVINTIKDLIRSGDKLLKIEAVLSGTLNYVFNTLSPELPLSQVVRKAKEEGYAEPDPRLDLSGQDVIRKIVILAREAGYPIEQGDVKVNAFLPKSCFEGSLDKFWEEIAKLDTEFETQRKALEAKALKWRYIAKFENGKAEVGLQAIDSSHPAYDLEGSNNILMLTTARYLDQPMIIKGYGAGADVTAAGVFADIIRIANV